ncbi:hypothetical protein [Roseibium sp. RKSG952]|uniref:hypothetical protein n=1 Tax=Roseibium sp. RKSG952 TaxID=2529384 RepID=UPI0012BC401A|nr:hypothetical protein [Roseibium sp. RKSG952]MTH95646.1 hypothetical protein [Roseibium sp. RKSG952]
MNETNLIDDGLIPVTLKSGAAELLTLPIVMELLGKGDIESFREVKAHQSAALHLFLAHLGVLGTSLSDDGLGPLASAETWAERLLKLAPKDCWRIFSENPEDSVFMQPGMPTADFEDTVKSKGKTFSPDEIGTLITSKNHTVKFSVMQYPSAWHWVLALIETQTLSGYEGSSLYGIPRMNRGLSTKLCVATYTDISTSGKWKSDVNKILRMLPKIYREYPHFTESGNNIALPWSTFWDGKGQIKTTDLHPLYIDCCRRLKLGKDEAGRLFVVTAGSKCMRIPNLDLKGNFGDPWMPLEDTRHNPKAKKTVEPLYKSISPNSISVELLSRIVLGQSGVKRSPLQEFLEEEAGKPGVFSLSGILRGQGETYGYHDIQIPIPTEAVRRLKRKQERDQIGAFSGIMLELAKNAQEALKFGVYRFCQPENEKIDFRNSDKSEGAFKIASSRFKQAFSNEFFPHLWQVSASEDPKSWKEFLRNTAEDILESTFKSGSSRTQLSFKAEALGKAAFNARWHNLFNKEPAE